jgi:hypothetical protein
MLSRICLGVALLAAMPVWSQVEPSATGPPATETEMQTPPPVSGQSYPTATGSEERSNFLRASLNLQVAYSDNVETGNSGKPVGDMIYTMGSSIALDQTTPRSHRSFMYSPGFTLYEPSSGHNSVSQSTTANYEYRLSPHARLGLGDSFVQSSNVFEQPQAGVSGSTELLAAGVVAPFAEQLTNGTSAQVSDQFSRNSMFGAGGTYSLVNYPNPAQAVGVANSNSYGGSGFYNRRLSKNQYMGVNYQYSNMTSSTSDISSKTQMYTVYSFYTLYLANSLSLSVSGGPQHFSVSESSIPASGAWTPAVNASLGWQRSHAGAAASYSRTVNGAGGLLGAEEMTTGNASARWQATRTWTLGATASYSMLKSATPLSPTATQGGHSISGSVSAERPIGQHLSVEAGYSRLHQSFSNVAVVVADPNGDREYISISYQFTRPLGR